MMKNGNYLKEEIISGKDIGKFYSWHIL